MCDVQFLFKDGHKSVGAHAAILSASSPVFAAMFQSDFVESKKRQVNIDNIEPQIFKQLLSFFYCGTAPKLTDIRSIQSLLEASSFYGVKALLEKCVKMLEKQLKTKNAIVRETSSSFRPIFSQPEWLDLLKNHPELCPPIDQRVSTLRPKTKK